MNTTLSERIRLAVPEEMRNLPAWLCWRKKPKGDGKVDKVPYYATNNKPRSGTQGEPADRAQLVVLDTALAAMERHKFDGVGIAMLEGNKLVGVDVDHAKAADGGWKPLAQELLRADTYAEVSPSGTGLRMFFKGLSHNGKNHDVGDGVGVELFSTAGFLTFTGERLNGNELAMLDGDLRTRLEALATPPKQRADVDKGELEGPITQGRNVFLTRVGGKLRYRGLGEELILPALRGINAQWCDPPLDDGEVQKIARSVSHYDSQEWGRPINIFGKFAAPPLTREDVPEVIGQYADLHARAAGFDPTIAIAAGVVAAAAMLHDDIKLLLPGASAWRESARVWSTVVGGPASGKSPSQKAMLKPVFDKHRELLQEDKGDF